MTILTTLVLAYFVVMSIAAFIAYGVDKHRAKQREWRISEKTLLFLSIAGGSVGALLAMQVFRHKTKHWYFYAVGIAGILWQVALIVWLLKTEGEMFV